MSDDSALPRAIIASEKRRRRRESHNAVERRRRDNINEKISELATLIPECMLDPSGARLVLFCGFFRLIKLIIQVLTQRLPKHRPRQHPMTSYWVIWFQKAHLRPRVARTRVKVKAPERQLSRRTRA